MREIKFRAWHPSGGWEDERGGCTMTYWKLGSGLDNSVFFKCAKAIMQFTGLKDTDGNEIYEGDIIDFDFDGVIFVKNGYDVIFQDGAFLVNKPNFKPLLSDCSRIRVVGNIYESSKQT